MGVIQGVFVLVILLFIQGCAHDQHSRENSYENDVLKDRMKTAHITEMKTNGGVFTNVEFAGSLEPNADLDCIPISQVTSEFNPPSLYFASRKCLANEEYSRSLDLFHIASGFAYYDIKQLADRSTRGARDVLLIEIFGDLSAEQKEMMSSVGVANQTDPERVKWYCAEITGIGPPTYEPGWAINHGIGVYDEPRNGHYLTNVDTHALWNEVLKNRCTPLQPVAVENTVSTIIEIIQEGDGSKFCIPKGRTMLEISEDLSKYGKGPNKILTTPEMRNAFKELYPC